MCCSRNTSYRNSGTCGWERCVYKRFRYHFESLPMDLLLRLLVVLLWSMQAGALAAAAAQVEPRERRKQEVE